MGAKFRTVLGWKVTFTLKKHQPKKILSDLPESTKDEESFSNKRMCLFYWQNEERE